MEGEPGARLFGRDGQLDRLAGLVGGVSEGRSGVLVIRGEAGVGKTALLDQAAAAATAAGARVTRIAGAESEMELAFAGLQQICASMLERLPALPDAQRQALGVALGRESGPVPDRFLVALALLTLLTDTAQNAPQVYLLDDAQWLDRASLQALSFAARRLVVDPVAMVFAVREGAGEEPLAGLPELLLQGLGDGDARMLLHARVPGRIDERVRDRIIREAQGNPLALLQLPRKLTPDQLAGGYSPGGPEPVTSRIERSFADEVRVLPDDTRLLLLVAAADPVGEAGPLFRAAERLGIPSEAAAPAELTGLVTIDTRVRFRHPLVRSVVYRSAPLAQRRAAHAALAEAMDAGAEPDRIAWHRAQAAPARDEPIAAELERSADRARARGGLAASAAFLAHAADLTPEPAVRGARLVAAAQDKLQSGAPGAALELLAAAEVLHLDEVQRARIDLLHAQTASAMSRGRDAGPRLLAAAERLGPLDPALSRETYLEALRATMYAGRFAPGGAEGVRALARAALDAPGPDRRPTGPDLLLEGLARRAVDGFGAAVPQLARALLTMREEDREGRGNHRWYGLGAQVALDLWDQESWEVLATRQVQLLRERGLLTLLPLALTTNAGVFVNSGRLSEAQALLDESGAITGATGAPPLGYIEPLLTAYRGEEEATLALVDTIARNATARGEGRAIALVRYAAAVLHNGLGQYERAFEVTGTALEYDDIGMYNYGLIERVEAAAGTGRTDEAREATALLAERAGATRTSLGLGILARSRAFVTEGPGAEEYHREALEELERSGVVVYLARAHLVYGEWLLREGRPDEARTRLRSALDMFVRMRADNFAERAAGGLRALGERVESERADLAANLTGTEAAVARLARDGHTNPEIAAQLFLSPRTVEWHLGKVFAKLGIQSRRSLRTVLREDMPGGPAASGA